ncbi:MAG: hypothetical protein M1536_00155 [Firmicutes bacterium]|nr:hypothetical protein [Bacillota bacterium]
MKMTRAVCATCKHLKVLEVGREFEQILDTEYTLFECSVFGWRTKEFYLMAPSPESIGDIDDTICEFWEEWDADLD